MPKTQSALLEAMAEQQVTVDGVTRAAARPVPPARDREPDRARGDVPAAGGAARPLLPEDGARLPGGRRRADGSSTSSAYVHPLEQLERRGHARGIARAPRRGRRRLRRRGAPALARRARPRDARARRRRDRRLGARQPRARARRPRLGAAPRPRATSCRRTSSSCSCPWSRTGSCSRRLPRPRARERLGATRSRSFRRQCLELAPEPGLRGATRCSRSPASVAERRARGDVPARPARRLIGLSFGAMRSLRRGAGSDVAGSRPYRPGDDVHTIDWAASARLSAARGSDEFIVRERFAEEAPRVVVVCDRRPEMAFFPAAALARQAARRCARPSSSSCRAPSRAGGFSATSTSRTGEAYWLPPRGGRRLRELREERFADGAVRRAGGQPRARARPSRRAPARRHVRAASSSCSRTSSPPPSDDDLARGARAPLGPRAGRHPGPDLGAELPRRGRHRRPAARPAHRAAAPTCG